MMSVLLESNKLNILRWLVLPRLNRAAFSLKLGLVALGTAARRQALITVRVLSARELLLLMRGVKIAELLILGEVLELAADSLIVRQVKFIEDVDAVNNKQDEEDGEHDSDNDSHGRLV